MKELTLTVSIDEANLILEGLGEMPFSKVFNLISKIQSQAAAQLNQNGTLGNQEQTNQSEKNILLDNKEK